VGDQLAVIKEMPEKEVKEGTKPPTSDSRCVDKA
jgi:hypothetical protein